MTDHQKNIAKQIQSDIKDKGLLVGFVAEKFGISVQRLSAILNGKERYVSTEKVLKPLKKYVEEVNTNDIEIA